MCGELGKQCGAVVPVEAKILDKKELATVSHQLKNILNWAGIHSPVYLICPPLGLNWRVGGSFGGPLCANLHVAPKKPSRSPQSLGCFRVPKPLGVSRPPALPVFTALAFLLCLPHGLVSFRKVNFRQRPPSLSYKARCLWHKVVPLRPEGSEKNLWPSHMLQGFPSFEQWEA